MKENDVQNPRLDSLRDIDDLEALELEMTDLSTDYIAPDKIKPTLEIEGLSNAADIADSFLKHIFLLRLVAFRIKFS